MIISNETLPVKPDKIADMVKAVNGAIQAAKNVYAAVGEYENKISRFHGKSAYSRFNINRWDNIDRMTKQIHAEAWKYLLERFEPFMASSELLEWERTIEKGDTPEFTQELAIETMCSFINRTPDDITNKIKECFESLRPRWKSDYKTNLNNKFMVGKKHIETLAVDHWGRNLSRHGEKFFHGLDLAFNLLDGKGVPKYPDDLGTVLRGSLHEDKTAMENKYFKFKFYQNGNIHVEFKQLDLLKQLNLIGSGGKLELMEEL